MCGFAGYLVAATAGGAWTAASTLPRMADTIAARGPDAHGYWHSAGEGVALAHRRLAVVDPTLSGHQPMHSPSGRYVLAFNGEIYNHEELRTALAAAGSAPAWRGHSDTESLLAAFEAWGIEATLRRALGMFAFAVWDRHGRTLTLARDRIGEKPLYYGWQGSGTAACFLFGSQLKALRAHPAFVPEIDRDALCLYLRHGQVPAPHSIFRGVAKLPPGCLLTLSRQRREPALHRYWSAVDVARAGMAEPFGGTPEQAVDALEALLRDAVRRQTMADVPLGAFLSGGIDSSTVVALLQAQSARPIQTFTIGFQEDGYDEAAQARAVAAHLGTEHTELYLGADQAIAAVARLPELYDEPFADSSQIATFLVARLARQSVTVALSGDGGDELFGGYNRYALTAQYWSRLARTPRPLRRLLGAGLTTLSPAGWDRLAAGLGRAVPGAGRWSRIGEKLHKAARGLGSRTAADLYLDLVSHWTDPASLVIGGTEPPTLLRGSATALAGFDEVQRMMLLDLLGYLPDDILVKLDRAAMGTSLETRVPLLDHRVVEFAWRLPMDCKLRPGTGGVWQTKWVLRQVLQRYVPRALIDRPKLGFGVPIESWLRGPLRDWAEALLGEQRLRREGFFEPASIRRAWAEQLAGAPGRQHRLWAVLMFQAWLEQGGGTGAIEWCGSVQPDAGVAASVLT